MYVGMWLWVRMYKLASYCLAREGIGSGCVRENSTVRLGASPIMGVDLPISID